MKSNLGYLRLLRGLLLMGIVTSVLTGCAIQPPQPREKANLARKEMTMDSDPLDQAFTQHVYFSKESASGGYGVGGGGCGCN